MRFLYNLLIIMASFVLKGVAFFSPKIKLFVAGRKNVFDEIKISIDAKKPVVWIHAASLGEFEQGRPVIEEIKKEYPNYQIVLTFFSPSGYEIRKDYELVTTICYLPMDTIGNAKKFLKMVEPKVAIFIKYEFWPNYLNELEKQNIPAFLISGIFREDQSFFKPYGFWMRKHLQTIQHFFVQDDVSKTLLNSININKVTVAGDTRFDRVQKLVEANEKLPFVNDFKNEAYLLVAGSTWPEDEEQLVSYINTKASDKEKFIIAPHNVTKDGVLKLKNSLKKEVVLYSEMGSKDMSNYTVFIVDTIGILSKIYAYANVAYIGGGYTKSGVHNTLEAATYGLPIVIGPNFKKFKEVQDLVALEGCVSVANANELSKVLQIIYQDAVVRLKKSGITKNYVAKNLGATQKIMDSLSKILTHEN
ncbi:3-deoxy-D-manno-octulosonic-acid transferase [Wenyingzhuangia heitensis]|uniref:3-deoxy-D-manno-octulosonic acid transferase n=1 Tax=Wenyingzhuangia heitensis TaxID=1487859 RepID=A0ABX0UA08_9FLAO|nr:glycosyltransferase N-terminal domain-containing protein [Wenyingzhuangia heitensis]NIJ43996.1 3-deoxy-D-manno-octulosonic-acid transferase [Wenyingzhuangia heitensis]